MFMIDTVSITDLKQNTSSVVKKLKTAGKSVIVLQHSKPAAVLVNPEYFSLLEDALEDRADLKAIEERSNEPTVPLDEYLKKRFGKS
jgi:prevent-host-death family protein